MDKQCSKCGAVTVYREGIGKNSGKPYKGYFCQDKTCKNVDFVKDTKPQTNNTATNDSIILLGQIRDLLKSIEGLLAEK